MKIPLGIRYKLHKLADMAARANELRWELEDWFEERELEATGEIGTLMCGVDCTAEMIDRLEKGAKTDG